MLDLKKLAKIRSAIQSLHVQAVNKNTDEMIDKIERQIENDIIACKNQSSICFNKEQWNMSGVKRQDFSYEGITTSLWTDVDINRISAHLLEFGFSIVIEILRNGIADRSASFTQKSINSDIPEIFLKPFFQSNKNSNVWFEIYFSDAIDKLSTESPTANATTECPRNTGTTEYLENDYEHRMITE